MHRKYYENADECCYYIRKETYQDMSYGVWVPHFKPEKKLIAYHNFSKDNMKPDIMYDKEFSEKEPSDGDICPKCNRVIRIININE